MKRAETKTDAQLLRASRTDAHAFRTLYDRYAERIYGYHLRRTRDPNVAYDLTAETFAQAWFSRARFKDAAGGSAGPWLFAIAKHLLIASVRRSELERSASTRLGLLERLDLEPTTTEPDESWLEDIDDALAGLPEGQRTAIELRVVHDLSYDQVSEALGTTPRTARVRVHRGLHALRSQLSNQTEAPR